MRITHNVAMEDLIPENFFISRREAQKEIEDHQISFLDFVADRGERDEYTAREVLEWLGY